MCVRIYIHIHTHTHTQHTKHRSLKAYESFDFGQSNKQLLLFVPIDIEFQRTQIRPSLVGMQIASVLPLVKRTAQPSKVITHVPSL
jgi:hypothetical protein